MSKGGYELVKRYEHDDSSIFLSDAEIGKLKIKIGKSHRNEKDWDYIKATMNPVSLYTFQPADEKLADKLCIEGVYQRSGFLISFAREKDCIDYAANVAREKLGNRVAVAYLSFWELLRIAREHSTLAFFYLDDYVNMNGNYLGYDGDKEEIRVYRGPTISDTLKAFRKLMGEL